MDFFKKVLRRESALGELRVQYEASPSPAKLAALASEFFASLRTLSPAAAETAFGGTGSLCATMCTAVANSLRDVTDESAEAGRNAVRGARVLEEHASLLQVRFDCPLSLSLSFFFFFFFFFVLFFCFQGSSTVCSGGKQCGGIC